MFVKVREKEELFRKQDKITLQALVGLNLAPSSPILCALHCSNSFPIGLPVISLIYIVGHFFALSALELYKT